MGKWETLKRLMEKSQPVTLDFSGEDQRNLILGFYGGEEECRNRFPGFYQNFCHTAEENKKGNGLSYKTALQEESLKKMQDGICLLFPHYDRKQNQVFFRVDTSVWCPTYTDQFLEVYDRDGQLLISEKISIPQASQSGIEGIIEAKKLPEQFFAVTCTLWEEEEGQLKAQLFIREFTKNEIINPGITSFSMINPRHRRTKPDEAIVVVYNRTGWVSTYDYDYPYAIPQDKQKVFLEVTADVVLSPGISVEEVYYKKIILKLNCDYGTSVYHLADRRWNEIFKEESKEGGTVLHINFDQDWQVEIPSRRLPIKDPVKFYMEIPVLLSDGSRSSIIADTMLPGEPQPNEVKMSFLNLLWGCVAEGTRVLMADGSFKRVEDLWVGDRVRGENSSLPIYNIYTGMSEGLLCIETERGHVLTCTGDHTMKTTKGMKTAEKLCGEDLLVDEEGPVKITAIYPAGNGRVYNVELETGENSPEERIWICEGLLNGDFVEQNRRQLKAERPTAPQLLAWHESELKNLFFKEEK